MVATNFRVAMHNTIAMATYDRPDLTNPPGNEWLIVERSGADGEVLTISDAGGAPETPPAAAPDGLVENNSMFGVLLHENEIDNDAVFLLVRHLPASGSVPGSFFPADGYARVSETCSGLHLRSAGRHAHDGAGNDIPDPGPGQGFSWHFDAWRRVWSNEVFTPSFRWWYCWWRCFFPWPWCCWWFFRRPVLVATTTLVNPKLPSPQLFREPKLK